MRWGKRYKLDPIVSAKLNSLSKEELPVIIRFRESIKNDKISSMSTNIKYQLPVVGGVACKMNLKDIQKLSNDPDVDFISFDGKVFALLDIANASVKSNIPHDLGYTGEGVTIAVIDTGITPHVDLIRPKNRIIGFKDFVNGRSKPYDDNGHGTHVAGIIASNGYSSNGKYAGIAPGANILAIKALNESGSGDTSDIVSAIQWVIDNKEKYDIKILNLSLGTPATNSYKSCPLAQAVEKAVNAGITVVTAAGNSGPSKGTILCPGNSPSAITVGAVDDNKTPEIEDDFIASFSSRGPTKDGLRKPDLVAPGVDITSLSNKNNSGYMSLSGTSMAVPVVTGACALLFEKLDSPSPKEIRSLVMNSCIGINAKQNEQGSGIINLEKMFNSNSSKSYNEVSQKSGFFFDNSIIFIIILLLLIIDI